MALGRRPKERQQEFWAAFIPADAAAGHVFYEELGRLLAEAGFDSFVEALSEPFYLDGGRPSIPPGRYFRMLLVGYFEGIDSQRGIAWRCGDSLALRRFLQLSMAESVPDHSSLTRVRDRLTTAVHEQVFAFVLKIAHDKRLLKCARVGVDSTTLEANAAMKSIVRKESGDDWKAYLRRLMTAAGEVKEGETPSDEEVLRFDRKRKDKKTSNDEWESPVDPDARIAKMKDGRTRMAYKAEHVLDLDSDFVLSATIHPAAGASDAKTLASSLLDAAVNLARAGCTDPISCVTADKGYPSKESLAACDDLGVATYMPEKKAAEKPASKDAAEPCTAAVENDAAPPQGASPEDRTADSPEDAADSPEDAADGSSTVDSASSSPSAVAEPPSADSDACSIASSAVAGKTKPLSRRELLREANRARSESAEGRRLLKLRSEKVERSFAHVCGTGGARRTWLRGLEKISKRYLMTVAARNLGLIMRLLFGIGTPRSLQGMGAAFRGAIGRLFAVLTALCAWFALPFARNFLPPLRLAARRPLAA